MIYLSVLLNIISLYVVFELWQRIRALRNHIVRLKEQERDSVIEKLKRESWTKVISDAAFSNAIKESEEPKRSGAW